MKYFMPLLLLLIFSGCVVKHPSPSTTQNQSYENIKKLGTAIINLDDSINKKEAMKVALIAYEYPKKLVKKYQLVSPPLWHNTLINMNLKKRGFCYHFAEDLLEELKKHSIKTIDLKWVTHKKSEYWEHNAILVKAKKQPYHKGIILDAWRNSGHLYWNYLKEDHSYTWYYDKQKSNYYGN